MMSSILKIDRKEIEEETSFGEYGFDSITFTRLEMKSINNMVRNYCRPFSLNAIHWLN